MIFSLIIKVPQFHSLIRKFGFQNAVLGNVYSTNTFLDPIALLDKAARMILHIGPAKLSHSYPISVYRFSKNSVVLLYLMKMRKSDS
jgi:hypothetical protein